MAFQQYNFNLHCLLPIFYSAIDVQAGSFAVVVDSEITDNGGYGLIGHSEARGFALRR
jgi:hypothetical protein